jgi:hypothetical protein
MIGLRSSWPGGPLLFDSIQHHLRNLASTAQTAASPYARIIILASSVPRPRYRAPLAHILLPGHVRTSSGIARRSPLQLASLSHRYLLFSCGIFNLWFIGRRALWGSGYAVAAQRLLGPTNIKAPPEPRTTFTGCPANCVLNGSVTH